ncbi:hypothetical protein GCK72_010559 [Caenorhabditis remanei]|uniref:Uncharacterized protein n=1 Tax=Caenorhabditis remanei TaxID=31234 RepID=A0A6A5H533_CAERE|nr:hypothetical protein GCK72_010559 [Caenorhabditis remanei]KAF1762297.1 hypothetical protein GCK72_010559 [Caenorhabditis remanei]
MENDRSTDKNNEDDSPMSEDDTVYVSASDQPGQITINLEKDMKRKITIISEVEKPKRPRRGSVDLRRQAIVNNAIRSAQSTASSRSRSRSKSRSRSRSRNRIRSRGRSLTRTRSASGDKIKKRSTSLQARSRSKSRGRIPPIPIEKKEENKIDQTLSIRLPTHLSNKSVFGGRSKVAPESIQLPSPLFILTEQQVVGASEKKTVQFVTKILLTSHKLSIDDRKKLYAEMVEAEYVGTSRSSSDLSQSSDDEPEEDFQLKMYYSSKGIYIHSVQNVHKIRNGKSSKITEEKSYSNICKTKIVGDLGKSVEGFLNVTCSETVSVTNQNYTRSEHFKIGLKDSSVFGNVPISALKTTFDPTKTISFNEFVFFDNKNIGIDIRHESTARMEKMWNHEVGSFGEEQSEYREVNFFFDDGKTGKDQKKTAGATVSSVVQTPKKSTENSSKSSDVSSNQSVSSSNSSASGSSISSKRAKFRTKRLKTMKKKSDVSLKKTTKSPDRESSRKSIRPDEEPLRLSSIKSTDQRNSTANESFYHSFPAATSTPKSPKSPLNSSTILQSNIKSASKTTPNKSPLCHGSIPIKVQGEKHSDNEIDLDKSLSSKKPTASKNLARIVESQKKKEEGISSKPPTSPGNSVYMYSTGNANNSTYMTAKDLHDSRISSSSSAPKSLVSPRGTLRVKETKVTREVRQEEGKPDEVNEKKEETVKEEKVKLDRKSRSISPATPKLKNTLNQNMVTLSTVKETHQTLDAIPIKVSDDTSPSINSSFVSGQKAFKEEVQLDMMIDKKRLVLNVNFMLLAEKQPEVEIIGFSFKGNKLWEKSSEWNLSSANTTSHTKTIARQASNILEDGKTQEEKK